MSGILHLAARNGRVLLIAGLLVGAALPEAARLLRPWLPELVAGLLFLTAIRVGLRAALGSLTDLSRVAAIVLCLQVVAPALALTLFSVLGVLTHPFALAVVLMLAAPSVTGAPNFLVMMGRDPTDALRILVFGTAVFPVTCVPVLLNLPILDVGTVVGAALRLVGTILAATALGFGVRATMLRAMSDTTRRNIDGSSALLLAVIVVGLMSEIGPLLRTDPQKLFWWSLGVMSLNFGLQIVTFIVLRPTQLQERHAVSIISGNRNIALFLIALPPDVTGPLLVFIGCYQIPMYLTPVVLRRLHTPSE